MKKRIRWITLSASSWVKVFLPVVSYRCEGPLGVIFLFFLLFFFFFFNTKISNVSHLDKARVWNHCLLLTLLHSERPKLHSERPKFYTILAILSAIGLRQTFHCACCLFISDYISSWSLAIFFFFFNFILRNRFFSISVEENTETIDCPLHEAAKRGNMSFLTECLHNQVCGNHSHSVILTWR